MRHWSGTQGSARRGKIFGAFGGVIFVVFMYVLIAITVINMTQSRNPQHPIHMCEDLMGVPAEHVEYDEFERFLVWVGDGSEHYCYAYWQNEHWIVSGQ